MTARHRFPAGDRTTHSRRDQREAGDKPRTKVTLSVMPEVWALVKPRRWLIAAGLALMVVNRLSGLVLPASTKFLMDVVIGKRHIAMLAPLVGLVLAATLIQAGTSFALTQLLSKSAQRLIAELRRKVQAHIGRLPVASYDVETRRFIDSVFKRHGIEAPRVQIETNSVTFLPNLIAATGLLSFISRRNLGRGNVAAPLREVRVKGTSLLRQFALVHRKDAYLSPAAVRFMELLRERGQSLFAKAFQSGRSGK